MTVKTVRTLQSMLDDQKDMQKTFDSRAASDDLTDSCEYIKDMSLAALDEIHELLNEVGWKPWATSRHINVVAARGEWIDAWHFMMNLANKLDMDEDLIYNMYYAKAAKNKARHAAGYDGVKEKCPGCKRALDDLGVDCYEDTLEVKDGFDNVVNTITNNWCAKLVDWVPKGDI